MVNPPILLASLVLQGTRYISVMAETETEYGSFKKGFLSPYEVEERVW